MKNLTPINGKSSAGTWLLNPDAQDLKAKSLYISDLDGTLLYDDATLSAKTADILNCLIEKGMNFTYATARSWSSAHKIMANLNIILPTITFNGTFIVNQKTGAIIESCLFDKGQRDYIIDTLISLNLFPLVYTLIRGEEKVLWLRGKENSGVANYIKSRSMDKRLMGVDSAHELKTGDLFYVTIIGNENELAHLGEIFKDKSRFTYHFQSDTYNKDEYWFEISPCNASKAQGINRLKNMLNLERVVCFGDNLNDISMFKVADTCYAVANAKDELKQLATGVIESNMDDGVAKWLKKMEESKHAIENIS